MLTLPNCPGLDAGYGVSNEDDVFGQSLITAFQRYQRGFAGQPRYPVMETVWTSPGGAEVSIPCRSSYEAVEVAGNLTSCNEEYTLPYMSTRCAVRCPYVVNGM